MKKSWKIAGALALLLLLGAAVVVTRQSGAIRSPLGATQCSTEELEQRLEENHAHMQDIVENQSELTVRAPTEEEKAALRGGLLSEEELAERLAAASTGDAPEQSEYQKTLSALLARVLVLRERFENLLIELEDQAREESRQLAASDSGLARVSMAARYLREAQKLERSCDDELEALASELRALTMDYGEDDALADTVMETYHTILQQNPSIRFGIFSAMRRCRP